MAVRFLIMRPRRFSCSSIGRQVQEAMLIACPKHGAAGQHAMLGRRDIDALTCQDLDQLICSKGTGIILLGVGAVRSYL